MVRTKTRTSGRRSFISRVAVRPLMPGMAMSINTTSGEIVANEATASRPVPAWPTTSMSGWLSSSPTIPWRMRVWSSTTRTRMRDISGCLLDHRRFDGYRGTGARGGADIQMAAQQVDALLHAQESDTLGHTGRGIEGSGGVKALAVVSHDNPDHRVGEANLDPRVPGTGVAGGPFGLLFFRGGERH